MNTNTKLRADREIKNIPNHHFRFRENQIMKIQAEFGYDRENAEKILEYQLYKGHQYFFNTLVGAFAWNRLIPFQKEASGSYPIFRKPWLRHSVGFTAFLGASYCAQMM